MNADRFRALALGFPEAVESEHMGHPDFRVRKKIFATLTADEQRGSIKCDPSTMDTLIRAEPAVYRDAWGGRWLGVELSLADEAAISDLLEDAWRMVAPKRLAAQHPARPDALP